jgi:hypothetical protein
VSPDVLVSCVVSSSRDEHNTREWSLAIRQAQPTGELVTAGEIIELDFPLHIRCWSGINRIFLRTLVNDWRHVFCSGSS